MAVYVCVCVLSCALLFVSSWIVAHKASLFMEFSKQEHWIGLQFPALGDLPNPGIKTASLVSCIGRWILYHCTTWEASDQKKNKQTSKQKPQGKPICLMK